MRGSRRKSRTGLGILALVTLLGVAACTHRSSAGAGATAVTPSSTAAVGEGATGPGATPSNGASAHLPPAQLGLQLEQLLGRHALLATRLMRSVVAVPGLRPAAEASLRDNTASLSQAVAAAYGGAEGARFQQLWHRRGDDLVAYASGVADGSASATQRARSALAADASAYGTWLATASKGRVQAAAVASDARAGVESLLRQVDAYAAHDYAHAYQSERAAFEQFWAAGTPLAKGSLAPKAAATLDAAPTKLRAAFAMLLGEHMELVVDAQRATFAGAAEFRAAASQLNANSAALARGLGAIVGPKKGAEFQADWADHVSGLMAYAAAVAGKDEAGETAAEQRLQRFTVTLATYFASVVHNPKAFVPLTAAITAHDTHLMDQVNAYATHNYTVSQQVEGHGYQQMLGVAGTLVDAIQQMEAANLPKGGSQTGGGGTARRP